MTTPFADWLKRQRAPGGLVAPVQDEEARNIRLRQEFERRGLPANTGLPVGSSIKDVNDALERTLAARGPEEPIKARQAEARVGLPHVLTTGDILLTEQNVRGMPRFAQPFGEALRELSRPYQVAGLVATAGLGPGVAAGIKGGTGLVGALRGGLSSALQPVVRGGFGARLGAEAAMGTGAIAAQSEVARRIPETAPTAVKVGAPLAAGLAGGMAGLGAYRGAGAAASRGGPKALNVLAAMGPRSVPEGLDVRQVPTSTIKADPSRFQFKGGVSGITGASGKLAEVKEFDPLLGSAVYSWQDGTGQLWVVNGHHRLELAKRAGQPTMLTIVEREADGVTEAMARTRGALINIAEGQGTPVDVAKFLRDSGESLDWLRSKGIAPTNRLAVRGAALANLDDGLFAKVVQGQLSEDAGVVIGEGLPGALANQREVAGLVMGAKKELTPRELKALIQEAKGQTVTVSQATLFGETAVEKSTMIARAKVRAWIEDELAQDRRLFGFVTKGDRPSALARGETVVNVARGQELAKESGTALEIFNAKANAVGPINDIVREAAGEVVKGGDIKAIREAALQRVRDTIDSGVALSPPRPSPSAVGAAGRAAGMEAEAPQPVQQLGTIQTSMGIGERPPQGQLFENVPTEGGAVSLAKPEALAAAQERRAAVAAGQQAMGEAPAAAGGPPKKPPVRPTSTSPEPLPSGDMGKSLEQADEAIARFGQWLQSPESANAWDLTVQMRKEALGQRVSRLETRAQELVLSGKSAEESMQQAIQETMSGRLPSVTTDLTTEVRDALFAKVYHTLSAEPFEMMSTAEALRNALAGKPVPRIPGTAGASAYSRLVRVFGEDSAVLKELTKGKKLEEVIEQGTLASAKKPVGVDQELFDYLRNLPTKPHEQVGLGAKPTPFGELPMRSAPGTFGGPVQEPLPGITLGPAPTPLERAQSLIDTVKATYPDIKTLPETQRAALLQELKATGIGDADLGRLQLELWPSTPPRPVPVYEAPIEDALKQPSLMPIEAEHLIVRMLKEAGMTAVDIGGFIKANLASVDFSWWRQQAPLILNHKRAFVSANVDAWRALWSKGTAKTSWDNIVNDPLYAIYDALKLDFLRPPEMGKGVPRYRGVEEFGYLAPDRPIPAFTNKLPHVKMSQRGFVTGTNAHNWRIFKQHYQDMLKVNERIASGAIKMKPGEAFSISNEMKAMGKLLEEMSGRASLGRAREAAPIIGNLLFAPRYALGRLISPRHLVSANKHIRAEAWKDFGTFVGGIGGVLLAGEQMGLWEVETDPRSSNFAKIRIGNTRIDPWGGYQQFVRLYAQVITNTNISGVTGEPRKDNPIEAVTRFLRGKAAPLVSLAADLKTGKLYTGEKVNYGSLKQWTDRITPLLLQDVYDSVREHGPIGAGVAPLAAVGFGASTYGTVAQNTNRTFNEAFPVANQVGIYMGEVPATLDMTPEAKGGEVKLTRQQRDEYQRLMAEYVMAALASINWNWDMFTKDPELARATIQKKIDTAKDDARKAYRPILQRQGVRPNQERKPSVPSPSAPAPTLSPFQQWKAQYGQGIGAR